MLYIKKRVFVEKCEDYKPDNIRKALNNIDDVFAQNIKPGQIVVLKPNWIAPCHKYKKSEWEAVITHPNFITCIIEKVIDHLNHSGKIIIADAPQTDSNFIDIVNENLINTWRQIGEQKGIEIRIIDLRDHEWINKGDLIVDRRELPGDPMGSVEYNLHKNSEFIGHQPSRKGYFGADYNTNETTMAHSNGNHFYRISKTVVNADVFINIPKLKTHKKAGITCALKNLVGINTYKNFLPHHTEGTPSMGGDQFPDNNMKSSSEVILLGYFRKVLLQDDKFNKYLIPVKKLGKKIFGETRNTIRSGNWYGNNTLWRTILDLNKLLLYGNSDGSLRMPSISQQKRYISIVDGIIAGEGNGPEAPDPVSSHLIIAGCNPVSVDCVAAKLMGFDYLKIPSIYNAFTVDFFPLVDFLYKDIEVSSCTINHFNSALKDIFKENCFSFKPHFGWVGHIEL